MKLNINYSNEEVELLGIEKSQEFGMSKDAQEMIFAMFTKNIYSNPIGSVVREITSNCFDAHKEAGVNDPVILKLTKENNQHYISFIDVGVGMSRERVTSVYTQYFSSTKRNDNEQIGGFGIGAKVVLAYSESYFLITNYNGTKYTYSIRKGTKSPVLDLLDKEKTTERNGTIVKIPIRSNDIQTFENEIVRQLYYFENLIFIGFSEKVENKFTIIQGQHFLYRGNDYNPDVHICLGRVAYPIDYSVFANDIEMSNDDWEVPIAIKIDIGEINVTVSREAIDYTETTKKLIKKKMKLAKEELIAMHNKQYENLKTIEEYYKLQDNYNSLIFTDNNILNINPFIDHNKKSPSFKKYDKIEIPSHWRIISMFYSISMYGKKLKKDSGWDKSIKSINDKPVFFVDNNENMPRKKNAYMKHMYKYFYVLHRLELSISQTKSIIKELTPENTTTSSKIIFKQFRELTKEIYDLIEKKSKNYSDIVVPDNFKITKTKQDGDREIFLQKLKSYQYSYDCDRDSYKISELETLNSTFYYGTNDEQQKIREFKNLYHDLFCENNKKKIKFKTNNATFNKPIYFVIISRSNIKYISTLKNFKPINEIKKLFTRKREAVKLSITAKLFNNVYNNELSSLFKNEALFEVIDPEYALILKKLNKIHTFYKNVKSYDLSYNENSIILNYMFGFNTNSFKFKGEDLINIVKQKTAKNEMLRYVNINKDFDPANNRYSEKEINTIVQLLKLAYIK